MLEHSKGNPASSPEIDANCEKAKKRKRRSVLPKVKVFLFGLASNFLDGSAVQKQQRREGGRGRREDGEREKNWRPDKKKKKNFYRLGKLGVRKEIRMVREKVNA